MTPRVAIATPTNGGTVRRRYRVSLVGLVAHMATKGIVTTYRAVDGADLPRQRDDLATWFLNMPGCTHLLCIDSDMAFPADLAERLLAHQKELIGALYPTRNNAKIVGKAFGALEPHDGGVYKLKGVGFGFVLIARAGLERIAKTASTT
jgi:hypothetical protein